MNNGNGKHWKKKADKGGRPDLMEMMAQFKRSEAAKKLGGDAILDPERKFVMDMQRRIYKEYNLFTSLTSELMVLFAKQDPTHDTHCLQSTLCVNSSFEDGELVLHYGIVYTSSPSEYPDKTREVLISLAPQGALITFQSVEGDDEDVVEDGPYIMQTANLEFLSAIADWLMRNRLESPTLISSIKFERYVGPLRNES